MRRRSFIKSVLSALGALFAPAFTPREAKAVISLMPFVPSAPASPFTAVYDIAQLGEQKYPIGIPNGDGPTNYLANSALHFKWPSNSSNYPNDPLDSAPAATTPWGSWIDANGIQRGTTAFASASIPASGALPLSITWDITTLMLKLVVNNTGVYITPETAGIGAAAAFASMQWDGDPAQKPKFHIITSAGTFDVGTKVDSQIGSGSGDTGMDTSMRDPYVLKPDLSTVEGIITSATLTLWDVGGSQLRPCRYDCYYLDMPRLVSDPVRQLGGPPVQGIAASVATNDKDLASHPSVIFYPDFSNETTLSSSGWSNYYSSNTEGFVPWSDYGLTAARIVRVPNTVGDGSTIISWRRFFGSGGAGTSTYKELYVRYLMKIDPDVYYGMYEGGVKLPGFEGDSRNPIPGISGDSRPYIWSYRMEHDKQSVENHGAYSWWIHAYDTDNQVQNGFAQNRPTSQCALVEGRIYCVEQRVKMNTKTGSIWNADGIVQIWLDGILVSSDTTRRISQADQTDFIDNFFANFFHGGGGTPTAPIHYEFGGVCVATQYIGPPKRPTASFPSWRPPAGFFADIPSINAPSDVFNPIYGAGAWTALFVRWEGAVHVRDYSALGAMCLQGGGHDNSSGEINTQGTLTFDFSTLRWEYHNAPTQGWAGDNGHNCNQAFEFPDGSVYAGHTYLGNQELPTAWGGGPKGSIVVFGEAAVPLTGSPPGLPGGVYPTSHKMDLSQAVLGYSRLCEGFSGGVYSISTIDEGRQGWWVSHSGFGVMRFVSKTGAAGPVTNASISSLGGAGFVLWPSKDVLIQIPARYWEGDVVYPDQIYVYDIKTNVETIVPTTGKPHSYGGGYYSSSPQEMATIAVVAGGTGYAVNDTVTFFTPDTAKPQNSPKVVVTSVGAGGAITGVGFFDFPQAGYTLQQRGWVTPPTPANPISQLSTSGVGTGATFNATWQFASDLSQPWYSGPCWCEPLRCVVMCDWVSHEIVTLTPPAGDIYASAWTYARIAVSHWAAGDPSGQAALNIQQQGQVPLSRFKYIDTLKACVLFTCVDSFGSSYRKPQIINLPGLG